MRKEKEDILEEHKRTLDKKLNDKIKQSENEKTKLMDELHNKLQSLGIPSSEKDVLIERMQKARADKLAKQKQLENIERDMEDQKEVALNYKEKVENLKAKTEELNEKLNSASEMHVQDEKNRQSLINSLQTGIEEKELKLKELKEKLETLKSKNQPEEIVGISPSQQSKYSLAKIVDDINEIKLIVSGKKEELSDFEKEIEFPDFPVMAKLESDEEDAKIEERLNELNKMKSELAEEKSILQQEQLNIEREKIDWKENLAIIKSSRTEDTKEAKKTLQERKINIEEKIQEINRKIADAKVKGMKIKKIENELKPYLNPDGNKKKGKKLDFEQKPMVQTEENFYQPKADFEDIESFGFSSDHESK